MQESLKCQLGTRVYEGTNFYVIGILLHANLIECTMYDLIVFTKPQIRPLLHYRLFCHVINMQGIWKAQTLFALSFFCMVSLDLSSLLLWWHLSSGNMLMCCKSFSANLSIILKVFGGFSQGTSCLLWWLFYVVDLFLKIHIFLI